MAVLKFGTSDYSNYVKGLTVTYTIIQSEQTNAAGNTVIDVINRKANLSVVFKTMTDTEMAALLAILNSSIVSVTYKDPRTNAEATINCKHGDVAPAYYTIQNNKVLLNEVTVEFQQL